MKKCSLGFMLAIAGGFVVTQAQAEVVSTKAAVSSTAKDETLGIEYRVDLDSNDHGFLKTDTNKPKTTEETSLTSLKLEKKGHVSESIEYKFKYDFVKASKGKGIEYAKATWMPSSMFGFSMGQDRVNQAGWENREESIYTIANSRYVENVGKNGMPFAKYVPVFAGHVMMGDMANITIQAFDDIVAGSDPTKTRGKFNKESRQPAWNVQYTGNFGPVSPLLQITSYDINHGKAFTVGVKSQVEDFRGILDYTDDRAQREIFGLKKTSSTSNISLTADYTIKGMAKPYVKYARFNVKDADEDIKGNTADTGKNASFESDALNDNGQLFSLGAFCLAHGHNFQPYFAYTSKSGKFLKTGGAADETETKTEAHINVGISGQF